MIISCSFYALLLTGLGVYAAVKFLRVMNERLNSPVALAAALVAELKAIIFKVRRFIVVFIANFAVRGLASYTLSDVG